MADDRSFMAGRVSPRDLDVVREGFSRHFAVERDNAFPDLVRKLDDVEATGPGEPRTPDLREK